MRRTVVIAAVIASVILLLTRWFLAIDPERRGFQLFTEMIHSAAFKSQSSNPWLANGRTDQVPVEGTIARGQLPLLFGPSEEESVRAGQELTNPLQAEELDLARGRVIYEIYCQVCHGAGGQGDGPVTRRGVPAPLPFSSEAARAMPEGQIFHIITHGYKNMPAYGGQIDRRDRWQAVHYVGSLVGGQQ